MRPRAAASDDTYVEAMLGLEVWSHKLYLAIKAEAHAGAGEHHDG